MSKQTGLDWFLDYLIKQPYYIEIPSFVISVAKQMENNETEISDEEIEKTALEYFADYKGGANQWEISAFIMGMKKYREQLKNKQ